MAKYIKKYKTFKYDFFFFKAELNWMLLLKCHKE